MMKRTVLMVRKEQQEKLAMLADREHVSIAEINRRAIDAYIGGDTNQEELELLASLVLESSKEAKTSLLEAHEAVKDTLTYFAKKRKN